MNKYLWPLFGFLALALLLGFGLFLGNRSGSQELLPSPFIGKPVPAFSLPRLDDASKTFSPQDMRGKVWLINFWGSWCPACRDEHPVLVDFANSPLGASLPIVGIDFVLEKEKFDEEKVSARNWLKQLGNPYAVTAFDGGGLTSINFGVYGAPETFLVDKEGIIRLKQIGPVTPEVLNSKILPMVRELSK